MRRGLAIGLTVCGACASTGLAGAAGRARTVPFADYRLHSAAVQPSAAPLVDGPDRRLRSGMGSLVGIYPFSNSGFHVAAGGRITGRPAGMRSDGAPLLATPRGNGIGGRRSAPAALVGLDRPLGPGLAVGVDGGAALGRLDNAPGRLGRPSGGDGGRLNEVARLTMRYKF